MSKIINKKLVTKWEDNHLKKKLFTELEDDKIDKIGAKDLLVKMIFVPTHGSFWLATHPDAIHPRKNEFLYNGSFTFGNGGVGEVIRKGNKLNNIKVGDYVCVFGHYPCQNLNCYSCNHDQRYIECDYEQGKIIGHGNEASDGTFSKFVVLPEHSWARCYSKADNPTNDDLKPLMFAYLIADVRNALIKNSIFHDSKNILFIGGGLSGQIAISLTNHYNPEAKIFLQEIDKRKVDLINKFCKSPFDSFIIPKNALNNKSDFYRNILKFSNKIKKHYNGKKCDMIFDFSSSKTIEFWFNASILSPSTICTLFGFGTNEIILNNELIKLSGLTIQISRGPGNKNNIHESINYIKNEGKDFINNYLIKDLKYFPSISKFSKYVDKCFRPKPKSIQNISNAYFSP